VDCARGPARLLRRRPALTLARGARPGRAGHDSVAP
jgi:hypothetical protein